MKKTVSRLLALLTAIAAFLLILTASIGLPIYIRPFYYAHIRLMDLPGRSGFTEMEIRQAYDQVLDYLTIPGREFATGVMGYSESGAAHFADCRGLFFLNGGLLLGSGLVLLCVWALSKRGVVDRPRLGKRSGEFYGAAAAIVIPIVVGGMAALDFDRAFVVFHSIFFPGKDNWIFDARTDQIILVLPQDFFMHCAMLIGAGILVLSGVVFWKEFRAGAREKAIHG